MSASKGRPRMQLTVHANVVSKKFSTSLLKGALASIPPPTLPKDQAERPQTRTLDKVPATVAQLSSGLFGVGGCLRIAAKASSSFHTISLGAKWRAMRQSKGHLILCS
eukprot:3918231-Amphidinium_carterae.1